MSDVLEKLNEHLLADGLSTIKDGDQVPTQLREMLALINEVTEAKLKSDLAPAVRRGFVGPGMPYLPLDLLGGRDSGTDVHRKDVITLKTKTKDEITVGDLIDDAQALQGAMARLMDEYIRLVIREEVKSESLESSGGESGTAPDAGDPAGTT